MIESRHEVEEDAMKCRGSTATSMHRELSHLSPRKPCGERTPALIGLTREGSTHPMSKATAEPKRERAASLPLADQMEKAVRKLIANPRRDQRR